METFGETEFGLTFHGLPDSSRPEDAHLQVECIRGRVTHIERKPRLD